jgi:LAO/AO transport system kinase
MTESARKILNGDARALARAATGIENRDPQALETLRDLSPFAGKARVVGITGPPGAGKSSLVDALGTALRKQGKSLAILAVDPSSRVSGGAILGDRIRMQQHHADPGIFIRSMATRGNLGGLARATAGLAQLMDAAGKDYVLIETVGVGQDEIEIAALAQVTVVVLVPGMGDDVQAIKAGIMEIADIFAINKSDQPGADRVERELRAESHTPIVKTVATTGAGIDELLAAIDSAKPKLGHALATPVTLDHLGISVSSLAQSVRFYESLGLAVTHREQVDQEKVEVAMLPAGDTRIELLEPTSPDSPLARRPPGLHHIALRVPDLTATIARLQSTGARILNAPRPGAGGHLYVFVHPASTGGVLLELIQEPTP